MRLPLFALRSALQPRSRNVAWHTDERQLVTARDKVGRRPNGVCVWDTRGPSSPSAAEVGKHKINRMASKQNLKRSSD
jgi:hypothetical protein